MSFLCLFYVFLKLKKIHLYNSNGKKKNEITR